jgi:hypothetical protein
MRRGRPSQGFTILTAVTEIWPSWFRDPATWAPWFSFLRVLFGLRLDEADLELFKTCTGRTLPPVGAFNEAWLICGRRAGKSFVLALVAVFLAVFKDWSGFLSPGETGTIKVIAVDRRQSRVIFRYCAAFLNNVPTLAALIEKQTDDEITLKNGISIEIQTASFRSIRGYTIVALAVDEIAYLPGEASANPDSELLIAARAATATLHGHAMLLCASSPYAKRGELFRAYREHFGKDGDPVLVWRAATRAMNATVPQSFVDREYERDAESAAAEYGAEFRSDLSDLFPPEVLDRATVRGRTTLPPPPGAACVGSFDASGGSQDSEAAAVAYVDPASNRVAIAAVLEIRPPFSAEEAAKEIAAFYRSHGVTLAYGDRYAGVFAVEALGRYGVRLEHVKRSKAEYFLDLLPLLTSDRIDWPDVPRIVSQAAGLQRRAGRGGRDAVDHVDGQHDDVINVVAIAAVEAGLNAAPALWRRGDLMGADDAAIPWPRPAHRVFCTAAIDMRGLAVAYWAQDFPQADGSSAPIFLVDFDVHLPPTAWRTVRDRLHVLAGEAKAGGDAPLGVLYAAAVLCKQSAAVLDADVAQHLIGFDPDRPDANLVRALMTAELANKATGDAILQNREACALAAAAAIGMGQVRVCAPAHDKSLRAPNPLFAFSQTAQPDASADAALIGVVEGACDKHAIPGLIAPPPQSRPNPNRNRN